MDKSIDKDIFLIREIKNNNETALNELIIKHSPLVSMVINKYAQYITGYYRDDLINDQKYLIYNAAKTFDESKNVKFTTWLGNVTTYTCLNIIKENKYHIFDKIEDFTEKLENKNNEEKDEKELNEFVYNILDSLHDKRMKQIFNMRIIQKMKWKDISENLGICRYGAMQIFNKCKEILKNKIKNNYMVDFV